MTYRTAKLSTFAMLAIIAMVMAFKGDSTGGVSILLFM
jgi:hypothetical protein